LNTTGSSKHNQFKVIKHIKIGWNIKTIYVPCKQEWS
jgi:hypothetical protein